MRPLPEAKYRRSGVLCNCRCHTTSNVLHASACCQWKFKPKEEEK